jgi:hypothetical protein
MKRTNDNGLDRDMTETELTKYESWVTQVEAEAEAQTQAEANRQALKEATLAKLGITADEVAALLS